MKPRVRAREERVFEVELEQRAGDDKPLRIIGHPVVYERWSEDLGGFRERVMPGALTRTLAEHDIRALFNHDPVYVLGRNRAGTVELTDGPTKLRMDLLPPDTPTIRDLVITPMERKDITQMSFAFRVMPGGDEWREPDDPKIVKKDGLWERDLTEVRLYDVSVVTFPAYTQTDAAVRSVLTGSGVDFDALAAAIVRADRGLPMTPSDHDLFGAAIAVLRSYVPSESESEPEPPEPAVGHRDDDTGHHEEAPAARSVARLLQDVEAEWLYLHA